METINTIYRKNNTKAEKTTSSHILCNTTSSDIFNLEALPNKEQLIPQ